MDIVSKLVANGAFLISVAMMFGTPLLYTALGGVMSENSGVTNIGLEGIMTLGAFAAAAIAHFTGNPWFGFIGAGLAGALLAAILAFCAITLKGDQTVIGTAINFIGPGVAIFLSRKLFDGAAQTLSLPASSKMPRPFATAFSPDNPIGVILNKDLGVYLAFVLVLVVWFVLYRTKVGLRIRACGEHPKAAVSLGINVKLTRYICVLLSGVLGGFGGAMMSTAVSSNFFPVLVSGHGFIALAAVIFGRWKPQGAFGACMVFGAATALAIILESVPFINSINGYVDLLAMLPYVITLIILMFTARNSAAPAAVGKPLED